MPLNALALELRLIDKISPDDTEGFYEILTQADERLLNSGKWRWTRAVLEPAITQSVIDGEEVGFIYLDETYESIVGCRIGHLAAGVLWQEIEYLEGGPGEIPVQGCKGQLLDQGVESGSGGERRAYRVTGEAVTGDITILARYKAYEITTPDDFPRCQSFPALKQMMMSIVYEENNDLERSVAYAQLARQTLDDQEAAYRGVARKIHTPSMTQPLRRRSRTNFP